MPPRSSRQLHIPPNVRLNFKTMGLYNRIIQHQLFCLFIAISGCSPIVKENVSYNHLSLKDSLSRVDYSNVEFNINTVNLKSFEIENSVEVFKTDEIPKGSELYMNLIYNVVINDFISWEAVEREVTHKSFISKLLSKYIKNTNPLPEYIQIDYYKHFPDTSKREYNFFIIGRIELSDNYKSYIIASNKQLRYVVPIIKKSEYYLLNIDQNHQLISTVILASNEMFNNGLGLGNDKLSSKIKTCNRLKFIYTSFTKSLDLPQNPEVNHRYIFTLRIRKNGEINYKQN